MVCPFYINTIPITVRVKIDCKFTYYLHQLHDNNSSQSKIGHDLFDIQYVIISAWTSICGLPEPRMDMENMISRSVNLKEKDIMRKTQLECTWGGISEVGNLGLTSQVSIREAQVSYCMSKKSWPILYNKRSIRLLGHVVVSYIQH